LIHYGSDQIAPIAWFMREFQPLFWSKAPLHEQEKGRNLLWR